MITYSIIMPVYNAEKYLNRSIGSILNQTIHDFELIIVDDGSVDNSFEILKQYEQNDNRIIVLRQENQGPGAARNKAIKMSTGKFVAFLDADDYWETDFLEQIQIADSDGTSDLIFIDTLMEREDGTIIKHLNVYSHCNLSREEMICSQITGKMPWGMSKVIRRDLLDKTQNGFLSLSVGEETIFSFEVLKNAKKVSFVNKPIYHYVQNSNGQHKKGDFDPWGPMVSNLKQHIIESGDYEKYSSSINALALKALEIAIYRYSCKKSIREALFSIKKVIALYEGDYDFHNVNYRVLDRTAIIVSKMIRYRLIIVLVMASRWREKRLFEKRKKK